MAETSHVVMFSGGIGSWAAAKRVAAVHGTAGLILLFTDTLIEDADLYRFLADAAVNVGGQLVRIAEGRTPWEVFRDRALRCGQLHYWGGLPQAQDLLVEFGLGVWSRGERPVFGLRTRQQDGHRRA